jgi:hypothetical protein
LDKLPFEKVQNMIFKNILGVQYYDYNFEVNSDKKGGNKGLA